MEATSTKTAATPKKTPWYLVWDVPEQTVMELAKDLCAFFHQESVMVKSSPTSVVFVKETI